MSALFIVYRVASRQKNDPIAALEDILTRISIAPHHRQPNDTVVEIRGSELITLRWPRLWLFINIRKEKLILFRVNTSNIDSCFSTATQDSSSLEKIPQIKEGQRCEKMLTCFNCLDSLYVGTDATGGQLSFNCSNNDGTQSSAIKGYWTFRNDWHLLDIYKLDSANKSLLWRVAVKVHRAIKCATALMFTMHSFYCTDTFIIINKWLIVNESELNLWMSVLSEESVNMAKIKHSSTAIFPLHNRHHSWFYWFISTTPGVRGVHPWSDDNSFLWLWYAS